jgi:hypothetical protein
MRHSKIGRSCPLWAALGVISSRKSRPMPLHLGMRHVQARSPLGALTIASLKRLFKEMLIVAVEGLIVWPLRKKAWAITPYPEEESAAHL